MSELIRIILGMIRDRIINKALDVLQQRNYRPDNERPTLRRRLRPMADAIHDIRWHLVILFIVFYALDFM